MSLANAEQLRAIEHNGGVLLSAGAGSGKTFVLTEHMIYIAHGWLNDFNGSEDDFIALVKSAFKKIVLMTFTNKAAGEIELRVNKRFAKELAAFDEDHQKLWLLIIGELSNLTITTIHGFCFKLIKQGFFKNVNPNISLTSEALFQYEIAQAFDSWVENQGDEVRDLFLRSKKEIVNSLITIFNDPSLRKSWLESVREDEHLYNDLLKSEQTFKRLLFLKDLNLSGMDLSGKKWFDELVSFTIGFKKDFYSETDFNSLFRYFEEKKFKIATTPRVGSVDDGIRDLYTEYKELNGFFKKYQDDFTAIEDHKEILNIYYKYFDELIKFTNIKYKELSLFTFSDLEYETLNGLEDPATQDAIYNEYRYLIIDEFQDTSYSQYNIIKKIIKNDFNRIFCVGDPKQAIYGFRGGELGVFNDVQQNIRTKVSPEKSLSLLNNYRSDQSIINLNNKLFEYIFKLGPGYDGEDDYQVHVDYQNFPEGKIDAGEIQKHVVEILDGEEKLSVDDIEYIEACGIIENIKYNLANSEKNICVLFRKLKPSKLLTKLLIKNEIPFISQVKVPIFEDPIISIFSSLIRYHYNTSESSLKYLEFEINSILSLCVGSEYISLEEALNDFNRDYQYFGLKLGFINFLNILNLASSNTKESLVRIEEMIKLAGGDLVKLINFLDALESKSYNLEFHSGLGVKRVHLMTAHASKGLQFNHVILGGMYTNESSNTFYTMLGSYPGSFQWRTSSHAKNKVKTPMFILEQNIKKLKEFSETKRLFYVATTRAENSLAWIDIHLGMNKFSAYKNCWINGLNNFLENTEDLELFNLKHDMQLDQLNTSTSSTSAPLFHIDSMGALKAANRTNILMLPELSVTRYSIVASCPRKFYLKNILKLDSSVEDKIIFKEEILEDELNSNSFSGTSSMQRGSEIHESISQILKGEITLSKVDKKYQAQVQWAVENFDINCEKTLFISEIETKFDVYGQMISGIPDLITVNKSNNIYQVWDFKTGRIDLENIDNYWAQLYFYGLYLFQSDYISNKEFSIKLVLCYVDEKRNLEKTVSYSDVDKYITQLKNNTNNADSVNPSHCSKCEYQNICRL